MRVKINYLGENMAKKKAEYVEPSVEIRTYGDDANDWGECTSCGGVVWGYPYHMPRTSIKKCRCKRKAK